MRTGCETCQPVSLKQVGEETAGDQSMDADAQAASLAACNHACGLHRMVELINTDRHLRDKVPTGLG